MNNLYKQFHALILNQNIECNILIKNLVKTHFVTCSTPIWYFLTNNKLLPSSQIQFFSVWSRKNTYNTFYFEIQKSTNINLHINFLPFSSLLIKIHCKITYKLRIPFLLIGAFVRIRFCLCILDSNKNYPNEIMNFAKATKLWQ